MTPARQGGLRRAWTPAWLPRARGLRWLYRTALVLAACLLLHALMVNVALLGGGLGWGITKYSGVVRLDTGSSFCLWPGVVYLRNLHLEVIDSNVHLEIEVQSGRANITLVNLLSKRFSTTAVRGEGFVLRIRPKFSQLAEARSAALPPLSDPPESEGAPPDPAELWHIDLQGVDAHFAELWVSEFRYRGSAHVRGGFELEPLVRLRIADSAVQLAGGDLHYGAEQRIASVEKLALGAELADTAVPELGQRWHENLSTSIDAQGKLKGIGFLEALLPSAQGLAGGEGKFNVRAAARAGRWVDALRFDYDTPALVYEHDLWRAQAPLALAAHAEGVDPVVALRATVGQVTTDKKAERQRVAVERVEVTGSVTRDLLAPRARRVAIDLQDLAVESVALLASFGALPEGATPQSGSIDARARLKWREDRLIGGADVEMRAVRFKYGDWSFHEHGQVALEGLEWKGEPDAPVRLRHAGLAFRDVRMSGPDTEIRSWDLRLDCQEVVVSPAPAALRASFVAASDDAKPALALLGITELPPAVDEFLSMPNLRVSGQLKLAPNRQRIEIERAESETIDVKGLFVRVNRENHAAVLFKAKPLSLGIVARPGDSGIRLFASEAWLNSELAHVERETSRGVPPRRRQGASARFQDWPQFSAP
jgi:hypothetical protein